MRRFHALLFVLLAFIPKPALGMTRLIEILAAGVTDDSGNPLSAGTVTVYDAGTTSLRTVYSDFALGSPVVNPYTLDSAGRAVLYTNRRVKLLIKNSSGATVRTIDNVGTADSDVASSSASTLAGDGLTAPGDGTLAANPDTTSLEVSSDALRVKPGGIAQGPDELNNYSLAASVGSNALTIALKDKAGADPSSSSYVTAAFRSSTLTSGVYNTRTVTGALSLVISSGSTLGHASATAEPIYVYLLDNAGTVELAASTRLLDTGTVHSTTAEGGAGAADSRTAIYSTTARSSVPIRLIGRLASTQTTAGTWAAAMTEISARPFASAMQVERSGPILRKKSGVSNTAYLQKSDATGDYPIVVSADTGASAGGPLILAAVFDSSGALTYGSGATASKNSTGNYTVTFTNTFGAVPAVLVNANNAGGVSDRSAIVGPSGITTSTVQVITMIMSTGVTTDCGFAVYAMGERP